MCDQQRLRPACAYAQSDQSLCLSLEYSMTVKLLTLQHLEFICLKGCTGSSESTYVEMPHCWNSHVAAHIYFSIIKRLTEMVLYTFWMRYFKPPQKKHPFHTERKKSKQVLHSRLKPGINASQVRLVPGINAFQVRLVLFFKLGRKPV